MKRKFHGHWMTFKIIFFVFPGWRYEWKRRNERAARTRSGEIGNANYLWLCSRLCVHMLRITCACLVKKIGARTRRKKQRNRSIDHDRFENRRTFAIAVIIFAYLVCFVCVMFKVKAIFCCWNYYSWRNCPIAHCIWLWIFCYLSPPNETANLDLVQNETANFTRPKAR